MQIISKKEAIQNGMAWYFTGIPCRKNHISKRNVKNNTCYECSNERLRQARADNPELVREKQRESYYKDVQKSRERSKKDYNKHIEKRRQFQNDRYQQNPETRLKAKFRARKWEKNNPGRVKEKSKSIKMRKRKAMPNWLTDEMRDQIKKIYLLAAELGPNYHVDHIHPINGKYQCGLHVPWNLQVLTANENRRKGNKYVAS